MNTSFKYKNGLNDQLCKHISKRKHISAQNHVHDFSNNELFIFYCNNSTSFESIFCLKTVQSRLFKKYLKRRKLWAQLSLGWLNISEIEHYTIVGAGAHRVGKAVSLWSLTLILLMFGKCEKGKLHILKKVALSTLKRYYKNVYIIALSCF